MGFLSTAFKTVSRPFLGFRSQKEEDESYLGQPITRTSPFDEKVRVQPGIPTYLPWFDELQNLGETMEMRYDYRRMLAHPIIKSCFLDKLFGVMSLELNVHAVDDAPRNIAVSDFVYWNLNRRVRGGLSGCIWSILSGGLVDGISVSEKVWGRQTWGQYKGKTVLRALKPKDPFGQDFVLIRDPFRNIIGVRALRYNQGQIFDPKEFVIYEHLGLFGVPGGMSDFRAAWGLWVLLDAVTQLRAVGAEKVAHGMLVIEMPPGGYGTASQTKMERSVRDASGSSFIIVPNGCKTLVENLAAGSSEFWKTTSDQWVAWIVISMSGATLQTIVGESGQNRGDTSVHQDQAKLRLWHLASSVEALLNGLDDDEPGLIMSMVDQNFEIVDDYPSVTLGGKTADEMAADLKIDTGVQQLVGGAHAHKVDDIKHRYGRDLVTKDDPDAIKTPGDAEQEHADEQGEVSREHQSKEADKDRKANKQSKGRK